MRTLALHHAPMKHLTEEQRSILQHLWNVNVKQGRDTRLSMRKFAKQHGLSYATTQRELNRGMEGKTFYDKIKNEWFYPEYCACKAQADAADKNANKGTGMKITNQHANAFQHHVIELKKSPAHARHDRIAEGHKNVPCTSTFYNHIDHGDIGVLRGQTPYHPGKNENGNNPSTKHANALAISPSKTAPHRPQTEPSSGTGRWTPSSPASAARVGCSCSPNA
jgi:IS30 family transposase